MTEINEIVSTSTNRMTLFQLNFLLLGKEPTIQAKIHRCVEELKLRGKSIEAAYMEIEEQEDHIKLLEIQMRPRSNHLGIDIDNIAEEIRIRQISRKIKGLEDHIEEIKKTIKSLEEESTFFVEAYKGLSKIETPKSWDDNQVQLDYWSAKYMREINDRVSLGLPIDVDLIRSIMVLPGNAVKQKIIEILEGKVNKKLESK